MFHNGERTYLKSERPVRIATKSTRSQPEIAPLSRLVRHAILRNTNFNYCH